ncbi:antitermination protein [Cronobacter sakazakii]|uniref:antitermination protein Q n=1 Tax=Cronobacter sakazakii TaxID=28141 RepID=UPI000CF14446|nr:antitermination protein [Cronobacter sakazakii]ELY2708365.1 antitermination protein [Cronobacter sakazakii]KAB1004496.1 antitermination protein [Cronobacter sakazakii]MBF4647037.1 antitermination protein [Cronobacter sakazakii]MBF4664425.1 antitermination protein [Cronobacter sakazakii]MBF4883944.1 antitermination protein [Cronobacter sakazakii]
MNLDSIVKFFAPKGMHISDSPRATASEQLTVTDVMAALGMTQAEAGIGLAMFLGKAAVSQQDREAAISWLAEYAKEKAPLALRRAAGKKFPLCMRVLATFAYNDYASSAADSCECPKCNGKGLVTKTTTVTKSHYTMRLPQWAKDLRQSPSDFEKFRQVTDVDHQLCGKCKGSGKISKRCQCGGTGKTLDRKETEFQGVPVYKECKRCEGRGYSRPKSSVAYRGILAQLPALPERTWRYNWKPFYERLVTKCFEEETYSDTQLKRVTNNGILI